MSGRNPSIARQAPRTPELKEAERFIVERREHGLAEAERRRAERVAIAIARATGAA